MPARKSLRIAVIPGDGIGKEVMELGVLCLETIATIYKIQLEFEHFDFASCDYYKEHGEMMPPGLEGEASPV
ncbi:hypothetical protein TrVGV298_007924 [Trichoderma virens]|nr:hypothetical protein TrVGV298_007924 [Trichoderma virens]